MKVVILCGGFGTRIRQEYETMPKPMMQIGSLPILCHLMKIYSHYSYKDFILCLGHKGNVIKQYFRDMDILNNDFTITYDVAKKIQFHDYDTVDWSITLVNTGENALKGARIKRIEKYINDDVFMLTYGDAVADINIQDLVSFHQKHGRIGTVTGVNAPSRFGGIITEGPSVKSFIEKPQIYNGLINGGFFVFNRKVFNYLYDNDDCDFEKGALEKLVKDDQLMVYPHAGSWACMDTYREWQYLDNLWNEKKAFWKVWNDGKNL